MSKQNQIIDFYHEHPGVHSFKQLTSVGGYPKLIKQMAENGILEEVAKGYYHLDEQEESQYPDLEVIATIVPEGVFCLVSALNFHNIGTQQAFHYHLAIPPGKKPPVRDEFSIDVYKYSQKSYDSGIECHGNIKVYSVAKTIADCFKFRNKIGLDIAVEALKDAIGNKRVSVSDIVEQAIICRVSNVIKPYMESIL